MSEMRLFDEKNNRLYLTPSEREAFIEVAKLQRPIVRTLCLTLAFSGCRISEALSLSMDQVLINDGAIVVDTLKKRRKATRVVPVPPHLFEALDMVHGVRQKQKSKKNRQEPLWPWSRQHAAQLIKATMIEAEITEGKHRCPKGLRHAYGVHAVLCGVPLNMLQKWMGHAQMSTTSIYASAVGKEEADIASNMW